jgi:hypothetical protein
VCACDGADGLVPGSCALTATGAGVGVGVTVVVNIGFLGHQRETVIAIGEGGILADASRRVVPVSGRVASGDRSRSIGTVRVLSNVAQYGGVDFRGPDGRILGRPTALEELGVLVIVDFVLRVIARGIVPTSVGGSVTVVFHLSQLIEGGKAAVAVGEGSCLIDRRVGDGASRGGVARRNVGRTVGLVAVGCDVALNDVVG